MLTHFTILLAGFSIFSAGSLLFAYWFFLPDLQKSGLAKISCAALLAGLASLQYCHYLSLTSDFDALASRFYLFLLMSVPACFYYFSRFVLFPEHQPRLSKLVHLLPACAGLLLPSGVVPSLAFLIGTVYCLWFAYLVLKLRNQHSRFNLERFFFGLFAGFAILALVLGLLIPYLEHSFFYIAYGNSIGITMLLVMIAVVIFPDMLSDIQQIAEIAYSNSKLGGIDIEAKKTELESLIGQESIYQNEKLSLVTMAGMLDLTGHQLSELVNTQYGYGFSRFVRIERVEQAKRLLIEEPDTSILAISIMTGFQSQSNFYSAFREITEQSPGGYRKRMLGA
jgi:AraC-like DNA-binding protein